MKAGKYMHEAIVTKWLDSKLSANWCKRGVLVFKDVSSINFPGV